jgi:hypothetical protein
VARHQPVKHAAKRSGSLRLCQAAALLVGQRLQAAARDKVLDHVNRVRIHVHGARARDGAAPADAVRHGSLAA